MGQGLGLGGGWWEGRGTRGRAGPRLMTGSEISAHTETWETF